MLKLKYSAWWMNWKFCIGDCFAVYTIWMDHGSLDVYYTCLMYMVWLLFTRAEVWNASVDGDYIGLNSLPLREGCTANDRAAYRRCTEVRVPRSVYRVRMHVCGQRLQWNYTGKAIAWMFWTCHVSRLRSILDGMLSRTWTGCFHAPRCWVCVRALRLQSSFICLFVISLMYTC